MPTNTSDSTLDQINSITRKFFIKDLADQITTSNPILMKIASGAEEADGGTDVRAPLEIAYNSSAMWYQGSETLNVSNSDTFFAAILPWAQHNVAISIPASDKLKNMGSARVIDLVKSKVDNAKKSVKNAFGTGMYSNGTTDPKSIVGARAFLSTTATYAGISMSTESWWQSNVDSTSTAMSLVALQTQYEAASEPPIKPNFATTTETLFNSYHALLTPIQRFSDSKTADAGFQNLLFRGCPVVEDSYAPSSYFVFWNLDYVKLYCAPTRKFPGEFVDFVMPHNQDVSVAHIRNMSQLVCTAPRFQAALTALTS